VVAPDLEVVPEGDDELLLDALLQVGWRCGAPSPESGGHQIEQNASECSSTTGVVADTSRYFAEPSNALIAPPTPTKWLWIPIAIASGCVAARVGPAGDEVDLLLDHLPVEQDWSDARRWTHWKCTLSGPFSSGICGCTGSPAYFTENSGYAR
jgi:hypothetical protein